MNVKNSGADENSIEISLDMIAEQQNRLLTSADFQVSPRLKEFLKFIVQETLNGRAGNIKAYNIAVEVFGRSEDFNPLLDPIVRVEAGKLRRQLERYYFLNPDDPIHISIPRGSYVPIFSYKGGKKIIIAHNSGNPEHASDESAEREGMKAEVFPAHLTGSMGAELRPAMIIMPFTVIGDDAVLNNFTQGLHESLLAEMSQSRDVDVLEVAATGVNENDLLDAIYRAQGLDCRFILHGRVQRSDEVVRIFAALTDAQSARRIWTERFDAPFNTGSLLDLQDKVSRKLVCWLADSFGLINRTLMRESIHKDLEDIGVYEASLRYHAWVGTFDRADWLKARQALEHSIKLDPDNAMVCTLLSDIYSSDYEFGYDQIENSLDLGHGLAKKALLLDPTSQMGHWALALNYYLRRDLTRMQETISRVFPIQNTNPYLFVSMGLIIGMTRDLKEGRELVEEALRLNPYSPSWCHIVPFMYYYSRGEYEEALSEALLMNVPTCIWDPIARAAAYARLGMKAETEKTLQQLLALEPNFKQKQERLLHCMVINEKWAALLAEGLAFGGF
ncbi:MAG: hypothetical protein IJD04_08040 [Desulfovibrionaceae bacterium]|nr:hypothetical protein [Desulfovibrionaceae bacterium]